MSLFKNHSIYVKIWGFHGGVYEERRLLEYYVVCLLYELTCSAASYC
jgi:hypothetical protein